MEITHVLRIGNEIVGRIAETCEEDCCHIAGGARRGKPEPHDLEIVVQPLPKRPPAVFGMNPKDLPSSLLFAALIELEEEEILVFKSGGERNKKYFVNLESFGLPAGEFLLDLFITQPPAQYGVNYAIRTGPGSEQDNFSKWVVTPRSKGGAMPDGYCVRDVAVWRLEQIDPATNKPRKGEKPIPMPTEESFLEFVGVKAQPSERHAEWGKYRSRP